MHISSVPNWPIFLAHRSLLNFTSPKSVNSLYTSRSSLKTAGFWNVTSRGAECVYQRPGRTSCWNLVETLRGEKYGNISHGYKENCVQIMIPAWATRCKERVGRIRVPINNLLSRRGIAYCHTPKTDVFVVTAVSLSHHT
jgi:hypothetical protein